MSEITSSKLFKTIFDLLPQPIFLLKKKNLKIEYCNLETQNLLGKSNKFLEGKELEDIFAKESILIANISEIIKKNGVFVIKDNIKLKNLFFEIQCVTSEELNNKFFIVLNKVTKAKSDFEQINHFDEIFSFLSHEINNPISSIKLASDLIKKKYTNVDDELLEIIKSEALRITRLFHNFTISETKNISIKKKENIHELIRLCLFKIKQMPNKLDVSEEFDPSLPLITINRDSIIQALDNILINAYESSFFNKSSYLKIQTRFVVGESISIPNLKNSLKKNSLKISICDNGNGIPKELIDKVFLPFYSTKKRGSGIGLFLVKRIIDDHEGTIALESQEGVTTAEIILPF